MLKHLKMKAAKLQDQPADLHDEDNLRCQDTEIVEHSKKDDDLANQRTQENFIHSTTLPFTKELETAKSLCETDSKDVTANSSGSAGMGISHAQTSTSHDTGQYLPDEICHVKLRTPPHGSNIHAVHNSYKSICQDPSCHCSPAKLLTRHSPNMEGNCSCLSCLHQANLPRVVHHNSSVPYLHPSHVVESSPHLHPPGNGVFYSPQHSYLPQKPFFQSPYDHEWSRFANPAYSAPNINHAFSNPFYSYSPKKLPSPLWSSPNKQDYRLGGGQSLTLPLARSTIVSLLKRGRCDSILHLLDGPLHDESSPMYPIALNTVLEILDVVEKEFAIAYTSDRKIKGDIHQLANFVKGMTNTTVFPSPGENVAQREGDVNSDSLLVKAKLDDNRSAAKTYKSPTVTKQDKIYETAEVNDSVVGPSKPPALGTVVTPSVPTKTIFTVENTRKGTTVKVSDQNAEESRSEGMSTGDSLGANGCELKVISSGGNEKITSVEEKTEVEKIPEILSNSEGNDAEKDSPLGCSSINCKDDEQNASAEGAKDSGGAEIEEKANGSHEEKGEKGESKSVFISKDSERPMPVLENELELQKLFVGGESKTEIDDRPLDSDIDALLDQSLMEADQAKSKVVNKIDPSKTPEDPSTSGPSDYRGKGYKVRAVSSSDKHVAKAKAPVKTFAQIREKNSPLICGSHLDHDIKLKADQKPVSVDDSGTMATTDLNGNIVEGAKTSTEMKISKENSGVNTDSAPREGTPDLGRCPSNPLSPSCSDSLDSTDFKSFLEKSRGRTSIGSVSNENDANGGLNISNNSALSLLDHIRKLPLPKEPTKQGGSGKPLISKSFHGKLLLQKHSKDEPHPIPLEITDSDFIPRDPRLSLSNLMESKVNYEFSPLKWDDNQTASQKLGAKTTEFPLPLNQSVVNVRDPRIRRRLSEDGHLPLLNGTGQPSLVGMCVLTPNFPNVQNSNAPDKSKTSGHYVGEIVGGNACNVLESENSSHVAKGVSPETISPKDSKSSAINDRDISSEVDISNSEGSSLKEVQNCVKENVCLTDADTSLGNKKLDNSNGDEVAHNTTADSFEQEQELLKSAIHSIRKTGDIGQLKKKEIPEIASTVSSCNISEIDKMDTVISFREALDVLKGIKSELKNDLEKCGSKIEKIGKDKIAKLCSKVKLLRQTCEVGLLSTEVQRKKASGTRFRDLCGLLEDHFILIADLTILGVWLKTWNTDVRDCREGLPEFRKGVFTRRTVPCFKKLEKWLKNRYKLDGFENEKLLKLVSMISQSGDGKRSRSRSSSTGSNKHKRKKARTASKDDDKSKKKQSKKSDHAKDPPGVESPVKEQTKRPLSPSNKKCGPNSKRSKDSKLVEEKVKPDTQGSATSSDSDTSNDIPEQSPSTKSGSRTPVSEAESPPQEVEKNASKEKVRDSTDSQGQKTKKSEGSSQRKQSVSVNSGIKDIQEDMEQIKKSVLSVFRKRSTSSANRCLGELTEISHKAHTQLEDENKTYTSLKNVSKDTKAKFHDVIKGIQRIIVDCEILVYSLSSSASKLTARETKDKIWENAQKSSHKPSYEEELALLLSLRKSYLYSDLWRYIRTDVDDRIDSLQKKCRSRDIGGQKCASSSLDYASVERPTSWMTATVLPCEQVVKETRLETPLPLPVADYDRRHEVGFHGPGAPFSIDYHGSYLAASDRNNLMELPNDIYTPPSNRPFVRDGYHPNGTGVPREPYQAMASFLPRDDHMKYDWRRKYDDEYDTWGIVRRNPLTTDIDYDGRHFTPPPAI